MNIDKSFENRVNLIFARIFIVKSLSHLHSVIAIPPYKCNKIWEISQKYKLNLCNNNAIDIRHKNNIPIL